ncbi:MAG TPA: hypothetical protein VIR27_01020 [Mycobacteriales bacterium]
MPPATAAELLAIIGILALIGSLIGSTLVGAATRPPRSERHSPRTLGGRHRAVAR